VPHAETGFLPLVPKSSFTFRHQVSLFLLERDRACFELRLEGVKAPCEVVASDLLGHLLVSQLTRLLRVFLVLCGGLLLS
jgi:hypothetical protein